MIANLKSKSLPGPTESPTQAALRRQSLQLRQAGYNSESECDESDHDRSPAIRAGGPVQPEAGMEVTRTRRPFKRRLQFVTLCDSKAVSSGRGFLKPYNRQNLSKKDSGHSKPFQLFKKQEAKATFYNSVESIYDSVESMHVESMHFFI